MEEHYTIGSFIPNSGRPQKAWRSFAIGLEPSPRPVTSSPGEEMNVVEDCEATRPPKDQHPLATRIDSGGVARSGARRLTSRHDTVPTPLIASATQNIYIVVIDPLPAPIPRHKPSAPENDHSAVHRIPHRRVTRPRGWQTPRRPQPTPHPTNGKRRNQMRRIGPRKACRPTKNNHRSRFRVPNSRVIVAGAGLLTGRRHQFRKPWTHLPHKNTHDASRYNNTLRDLQRSKAQRTTTHDPPLRDRSSTGVPSRGASGTPSVCRRCRRRRG